MPDDNDTNPTGQSPSSPTPDPLGIMGWTIGGKYRITRYIGGGGFGEVYEGFNVNLTAQRLVVKFFKRVQEREKFDKEARILCLLDHPHISRVIDYLPAEGAVVVAFIDGKDGRRILRESGRLPEKQYLNVARSLTSAVAYAHEKKIAHRDIKPDNILIDKNDHVYLIDFGIAKQLGGEATRTGYQALTPMIAAPERQQGDRAYNPFLSDVYEIGITLFNFATNSLPYRNPVQPDVSDWGGEAADRLSPELRLILRKATQPDPSRRYQSASELAAEFRKLENVYYSGAKRRRPMLLVAAVIVAVLAITAYLSRDQIASLLEGRTVDEKTAVETEAIPGESPANEEAVSAEETQKEVIVPEERPPVVAKPPVQTQPTPAKTEPASPPLEKKEEAPVQAIREEPAPPPQEVFADVTVRVNPAEKTTLWVGKEIQTPGRPFTIKPGRHEVTLMHPDFPVYRQVLDIPSGRAEFNIDLASETPGGAVDLQMALAPPSDNYILELSFNGRKQTFTRFPILGLERPAGEWAIEMRLTSSNRASGVSGGVDSCVAFPYGGGKRYVLRGAKGPLRLEANPGEMPTTVPVVIYWSEH